MIILVPKIVATKIIDGVKFLTLENVYYSFGYFPSFVLDGAKTTAIENHR